MKKLYGRLATQFMMVSIVGSGIVLFTHGMFS